MTVFHGELLEALRQEAALSYLSDLHVRENHRRVLSALSAISEQAYSAAEWQRAAAYILGEPCGALDAAEAKRLLLLRLR